MSIILGKHLGTGGNCDVYEIGDNKVVKLYFSKYKKSSVEREYNKTLNAYKNGVPTPQMFKIIQHENRFGLVMEKIEGQTLMEIIFNYILTNSHLPFEDIFNSHEILGNTKKSAQILYNLHKIHADMNSTVENTLLSNLERNQFLTDEEKAKIKLEISLLPKGQSVCHGDPNPGNVIKSGDEYRLIDWVNSATGHPFYDLAYYVLMVRYIDLAQNMPPIAIDFLNQFGENFIDAFLSEYEMLSGCDLSNLNKWYLPICVERLNATALSRDIKLRILEDIRKELI